jgi:hypothetical protein
MAGVDTNLFTYDDPRPSYPFKNRWLDDQDMRAAFVVVLPQLAPISDFGMCWDDVAITSADYHSPIGRRALCAWDVPATTPADQFLQGCYDGFDAQKNAVYAGIYDLLQQIKAGGVLVELELHGQ